MLKQVLKRIQPHLALFWPLFQCQMPMPQLQPKIQVVAALRSNPGARRLLLASLLYFPALLLVMLLDRVIS